LKKGEARANCEYLALCTRLKSFMCLPWQFFGPDADSCPGSCYCAQCCSARGDKGDKGNPVGWCRFPVRRSRMAAGDSIVTDGWHTAYHGCKAGHVRKMLDRGEITQASELGIFATPAPAAGSKESKEDDADSPQLMFSPSIKYVGGSDALCPPFVFRDKVSRRNLQARVCFQVEIHPGSYKVGPAPSSSSNAEVMTDPDFKEEEMQWLTKEKGNTLITALMMFVDVKQ
jgi:hypothetical protein